MKPLKLTKKHKSKLLEMCGILFPEYPEVVMTIDYFNEETGEIEFRNWTDKNRLNWTRTKPIHWFEFCITHLTTKLYNISYLKNESSIKQLRGYICQEVDHPIDYLYEEFKKLKL